jgi:hypothetical protein
MSKGKRRALDDANLQQLARAAIHKLAAGQTPTREELRAKSRVEADVEERKRWEYYRTIPKKHWIDMSGRQHKVLDGQAKTYGLPIAGDTVDLAAVVRWLHDFLANNGRKLLAPDSEADLVYGGGDSPMLELVREETWKTKKLERLQLEGRLVDRELVRSALAQFAAILRNCGDALQKQHGSDALELLLSAIEDGERLLEREFAVSQETSLDTSKQEGRKDE